MAGGHEGSDSCGAMTSMIAWVLSTMTIFSMYAVSSLLTLWWRATSLIPGRWMWSCYAVTSCCATSIICIPLSFFLDATNEPIIHPSLFLKQGKHDEWGGGGRENNNYNHGRNFHGDSRWRCHNGFNECLHHLLPGKWPLPLSKLRCLNHLLFQCPANRFSFSKNYGHGRNCSRGSKWWRRNNFNNPPLVWQRENDRHRGVSCAAWTIFLFQFPAPAVGTITSDVVEGRTL